MNPSEFPVVPVSASFSVEDVKDFIDRISTENSFRRFAWSMRLSYLLSERGLREIDLVYDCSERCWRFSLRWGLYKPRNVRKLEASFRAAVCRIGRRVREGSFHVVAEGDLLTGHFIADKLWLTDEQPPAHLTN